MIPTGREAGDDVRAADAMAPAEPFRPFGPIEPMPMPAPTDAPAGGAGESATQGTDSAPPEPRDPRLPRRVPQPSQLRGQATIPPAQPAEQTLRHLRDVLDRLP
ncbi:hypothetical protein [Catenulispora rubra]|uniref:hypothetical protein n=1 Tax=Catenulispora rubra TaxID=280293 RepID=UPI0018926C58|nr:hypothetical protein [Catenulispora rubra]